MSWRAAILAIGLGLGLCGCAVNEIAAPEPVLDDVQIVRAEGLPSMNVGDFTPGPGAPTGMDKSIMARAGVDPAPGGSFAKFLGDTLAAQLRAAGRLDPNSDLVVTGLITDTHLATEQATSDGRLAARFTLSRKGQVVFEKTFAVKDAWDSDFVGSVAIPDAFNHYAALFPKLVTALLTDPEFQAAAKSD